MIKQHVLAACRHLLAPIARLLLRSGVTWGEFAELSKEVFVDVARRDYGIQGRPTNNSRVAMITGLSRREVTRVRDILIGEAQASEPPSSRVAQVLSGWHVDPDFLDDEGQPMVLPVTGERRSLEALLKRYAGDLPHGAFLKELQQLGLVESNGTGSFRVTRARLPAGPGGSRHRSAARRGAARSRSHVGAQREHGAHGARTIRGHGEYSASGATLCACVREVRRGAWAGVPRRDRRLARARTKSRERRRRQSTTAVCGSAWACTSSGAMLAEVEENDYQRNA